MEQNTFRMILWKILSYVLFYATFEGWGFFGYLWFWGYFKKIFQKFIYTYHASPEHVGPASRQ